MPIRQKDILKALRESPRGEVVAVGRSSILCKLLGRSLTRYEITIVDGHLDELHIGGRIVVQRDQAQRITSIRLPELAASKASTDESEATMPAPRGYHETKSPKTGDCKPIGYTLSDDQVGPVKVRHVSQTADEAKEAADEVATAGGLVLEELAKADDKAMTYEDLALFIRAVINALYTPATLPAVTRQVVDWLVENKHLNKGKPVTNKPATYTFLRPEPAEQATDDPNEAILRLIADMKVAQETEARLNREVTALKQAAEQQISQEQLSKILDDLKRSRETEKRLNREIQQAKVEQERKDKAHAQEVKELHEQLAAAQRINNSLQQQLETRPPSSLDPSVQQQLRELGY